MPRRSKVKEKGLEKLVIEYGLVQDMSVPEVQKRIQKETGEFLSPDSIRNYLDNAPAALVERAEEQGLQEIMEPILDYETEVRGLFEDVVALKDRVMETLGTSEVSIVGEPKADVVASLADQFGLSQRDVRAFINEYQRRHEGPRAVDQLLKLVRELRQTTELAAKLDQKFEGARRRGDGPGRVDVETMNVFTASDMQKAFDRGVEAWKED